MVGEMVPLCNCQDLRKTTNLLASQLLHRLNILGIPWGEIIENSQHTRGRFKEIWQLEWEPDYAIRIIEAGMWGNTIQEAATNLIIENSKQQKSLGELTELIQATLNADLKEVIDILTKELTNLSALTKDIVNLMEALPTLVNIISQIKLDKNNKKEFLHDSNESL